MSDDQTQPTPKKRAPNAPADWRDRFLAALRRDGVVAYAAKAARVTRTYVYEVRESDPAFAAAWADAIEEATDALEREAIRRATKGLKRHKRTFYRGVEVADDVETEYSDTLLMFLMKARRPDVYRERYDHSIHSPGSNALRVVTEKDLTDEQLAAIIANQPE